MTVSVTHNCGVSLRIVLYSDKPVVGFLKKGCLKV